MNEEILAALTQIKWLLGIICIYLVWRDILKDSGRGRNNKS
jgi:hypothetical protein